MMVSGNNKHSACQSGYFEPKFSRILEAEVGFYIDHQVILLDLSLRVNKKTILKGICRSNASQKKEST